MRVKVLSFENFDGAGGRIAPDGLEFSNPVPVLRDFDARVVVGYALLEKAEDGVYASLSMLATNAVGLTPGAGVEYRRSADRRIPRVLATSAIRCVSLNAGPNQDRTILPIAVADVV